MTSLPDAWRELADELDLDVRPCDPPDDTTGGAQWFDVLRRFGDEGFMRLLASPDTTRSSLRLELAPPRGGSGPEWVQAVASELKSRLDANWNVDDGGPPWTLTASVVDGPNTDNLAPFLTGLMQLGDYISSPDSAEPPAWLTPAEGSREAPRSGSEQMPRSGDTESRDTDGIFETIGDDAGDDGSRQSAADDPDRRRRLSGHGSDARLAAANIVESDGSLQATITLDRDVSTSALETLGRGLAHTLRARFGVHARPLPAGGDSDSTSGTKTVSVRIDEMDSERAATFDATEMADRLDDYFGRLEKFGGHGLALADVLGLGDSADEQTQTKRGQESTRGSRRTIEESRDTKMTDQGTEPEGSGDEPEDDGVVLNLEGDASDEQSLREGADDSGETVLQGADSGLQAGNYTDPRLKREDAETALVDVVLRHPGYAERRMAHNLGILLDVDFTDAMELVQDAPCLIAWGVGRERGLRFKQVIENAGGKVVLVEPETFTPAE